MSTKQMKICKKFNFFLLIESVIIKNFDSFSNSQKNNSIFVDLLMCSFFILILSLQFKYSSKLFNSDWFLSFFGSIPRITIYDLQVIGIVLNTLGCIFTLNHYLSYLLMVIPSPVRFPNDIKEVFQYIIFIFVFLVDSLFFWFLFSVYYDCVFIVSDFWITLFKLSTFLELYRLEEWYFLFLVIVEHFQYEVSWVAFCITMFLGSYFVVIINILYIKYFRK